MADRFAYLYGEYSSFNLRALAEEFSAKGITLENPANGRVTALSEEGDQVDASLDYLEEELDKQTSVTFQFWLTNADHADLCCRVRRLSGGRLVEEYSLTGLLPEERDRVLVVLVERFKSKAVDERGMFFVADQEGRTLEVDWDELSTAGRYDFTLCPNVLALPHGRLADFKRCARKANVAWFGDYVIMETTS